MRTCCDRWICFADDRGYFRDVWHMVITVHGKARVLCGENRFLNRAWKYETAVPAKLCMNCLHRLSWRWGRAEWSSRRRIRDRKSARG